MSLSKGLGQGEKKIKPIQIAAYSLSIGALVVLASILQSTCLTVFDKVPPVTLAIVCATGFIMGEKWGAVWGIVGGVAVSLLGHGGFSFAPVTYMLCGYFCGALVGWFLTKNLPSFIAYALISGIVNEIFTVAYFGLFSREISVLRLILVIVVPEYLAYVLCILPAYFAVLAVFSLFKGKDKRGKRA
jgi:hypothetical protein